MLYLSIDSLNSSNLLRSLKLNLWSLKNELKQPIPRGHGETDRTLAWDACSPQSKGVKRNETSHDHASQYTMKKKIKF